MMGLTSSDVVLRYFFNRPIKGSYDIVGLLGAVTIALSIGYTQLNGRHVATEFIQFIKSRAIQGVVRTVGCLLSIGMYAILAWQCGSVGAQFRAAGRVSDTVQIPIYPLLYIVALGCAVNCLVLLVDLFRSLLGDKSSGGACNGQNVISK